MTKLIIAGSRSITSYEDVKKSIEISLKEWDLSPKDITEVVSGHAGKTNLNGKWLKNVDQLGEFWAQENYIPIKLFPADWGRLGKRAGVIRNAQMANFADRLIVVWDGESRGTYNMIDEMSKLKKPVIVKTIRSESRGD